MTVKDAKLSDLTPDTKNANRGTQRGLRLLDDSLRQCGAGRSILVDKHGRIIAGNKTAERAADIGLEDVLVVQTDGKKLVAVQRVDLDLDDEEARKLAYYDNRVGELDLDWDIKRLEADLEAGLDLSPLFQDFELEGLVVEAPEPPEDAGPQIDKADELQQAWQVKRGDVWEIPSKGVEGERHRLMCGDSTDNDDVEVLVHKANVWLVITSPPYPGAKMWQRDDEEYVASIERLDALNLSLLQVAHRFLSSGGVALWNVADVPFGNHGVITTTTTTTTAACQEVGFMLRGVIIWDKGIPHLTPPSFMRRPCVPTLGHEHLLLLFKGDWVPREKTSGIPDNDKQWMARSVWSVSTESASKMGHIAPFPVEIARRGLSLWSLPGDIVMDLCLGSGTTMVAAEQSARLCYGMEIEPRYVSVSLQRMADLGLEPHRVSEDQ